jgi:hypothetical protein
MAVMTLPPNTKARGPQVTTPEAADAVSAAAKATSTIKVTRALRRKRPPLAPASVYAPQGRRRHWWYCYPCRICATWHFGRARDLDQVADVRRAGCGHQVQVMAARIYDSTCLEAAPTRANIDHFAAIVCEHADRRYLAEHADRLRRAALNPGADIADVRALAIAPLLAAAADNHDARGRRLILTRASEIEPEPVVWAWEDNGAGRIPAGSLGLAAGREGTGKSSFLIWMAAQITTGTLTGSIPSPRGVIYVAVEDSWKYTIVPRLMAAGADLKLVYRAEVQAVEGGTVSLSLPADNRLLEEAITGNDIAMVALDPLMSAISDTLDTHVNRQVRQALDPLARIADRTGAVFAGIAHFNKSASTDASSLITASGAFKDVARFIFAFATDPEDGTKVMTQTKNSLGHSDLPSLAYRIIEATVPTAKGIARVGRFILDGPSERTVQDFLGFQGGGGDRAEKARAEDYLKKALASGPQPAKDIEEEAREAHGISKRTLDRARQALNIPTAKRSSRWYIALPEHEGNLADIPAETAKDAKDANPGTVGNDAKAAKAASPGKVGRVGALDSGQANPDGGRAA